MKVLLLAGLVLVTACDPGEAPLLDRARVLSMHTEPSTIVPPASVTASVRLFDPEFRMPSIQWYLVFDPLITESELILQDLSDPSNVDNDDIFYLGSGTQVVGTIPELDLDVLPEEDIFDTLSLVLLASVKVGDEEFKGFKQVRVVLSQLVAPALERQLGRAPTDAEVQAAIAVRRNANPVITDLDFSIAAAGSEYTFDMTRDLKKRREAPVEDVSVASGFEVQEAIRILPAIADADLPTNPEPAQPGYNKLEVEALATAGNFFPLSLTEYDWVPFRDKIKNKKQFELVTAQWILFDRQGGVDNIGFEIDAGAQPRDQHRGSAGSILLSENHRMHWFRVDDQDLLAAFSPGDTVELTASTTYSPVLPHGIVATVAAARSTTAPATNQLNLMENNPTLRHDYNQTPLTFRGTVVRTWTP